MRGEIELLMIINASFGDESDRQKKRIEDLVNQLKFDAKESEAESETESKISSESFIESEEVSKKTRRIQSKRKVKKPADDLEIKDANTSLV